MSEKRTVLLTGASSGIGEAIGIRLVEEGYFVYGIGRNFSETNAGLLQNPLFRAVSCDLLDEKAFQRFLNEFPKELKSNPNAESEVSILVNNAGEAYYGLHEEISPEAIHAMVRVNLEIPMLLSRVFLQHAKSHAHRGPRDIITIASVTAQSSQNPHGAAYGATKAGLLSFDRSLFSESRKYGIRVTTILPDMTDTRLYRNAEFGTDPSAGASLSPEEVSEAVLFALSRPDGVTVPEIMIRPQLQRIRRKQTCQKKTDHS